MEKGYFDGIIIPVPGRRFGNNGFGAILGITMTSLETAPSDIKINIATPNEVPMNNFDLFWLENCPSGNGAWGQKACYYWLLQEFSNNFDLGKKAVRVKSPSELEDRTGQQFIFWEDGEAVKIGNQYSVGARLRSQLLAAGRYDFGDLVAVWADKNYKLWSMTIGELNSKTDQIIGDIPAIKLVKARRDLNIASRNAGWPSKYPLIQEVV